ncbi:MAG TPA: discoidin domain-containing protein, partial [Polyangiaceae bacterium]
IGGLLALGALFVAIPLVLSSRLEERKDLALGKAWTASSSLSDVGCTSPLQTCAASPDYFFHTLEEDNPWLAIDLGSKKTISAVRVKNRADCCADRAVPLIVETSLDNKSWQRVARRTEEFTDWKAKFAPTTARFVRLTVPRRTLLHLQAVRVLP